MRSALIAERLSTQFVPSYLLAWAGWSPIPTRPRTPDILRKPAGGTQPPRGDPEVGDFRPGSPFSQWALGATSSAAR